MKYLSLAYYYDFSQTFKQNYKQTKDLMPPIQTKPKHNYVIIEAPLL